ncbi:MAG TPA: CapA family protein [Patescibacteria group bacterium]|nr:CapA family protein [Patescibacteria group bacterium]
MFLWSVGVLIVILVHPSLRSRQEKEKQSQSLNAIATSGRYVVTRDDMIDRQLTPTPRFSPSPLSLDRIFSEDHTWIATLAAERVRTVIATGDVLLARAVNLRMIRYNNFLWPFEKTADILRSADITVINLETPLIKNCPVTAEGMIFCGDQRNVEGLVFSGVDVVTIANNHIGNWGQQGVDDTVAILSNAGMIPVGNTNPGMITIGDSRFTFLGYNDVGKQTGVRHVDDGTFEDDIRLAKQNADVVTVSFHWGVEYTHKPTGRQIDIAHRTIDAGADLVIGNHPHWVQPPEIYQGKLIVYSHGNFIFDQMWSQKTREGIVGRYTFYDDTLIDAEFLPVIIEDFGQPRWANDEEKRIMDEITNVSITSTL